MARMCPKCGARLFMGGLCAASNCDGLVDFSEDVGYRYRTPAEGDHTERTQSAIYAKDAAQDCPKCHLDPCRCITWGPGRKRRVTPNARWVGWRDRQPKRNPVVIKQIDDPASTAHYREDR